MYPAPSKPGYVEAVSGPNKHPYCNVLMYVDTGSNVSSITQVEAEKMSFSIESLPKENTAGIGGFASLSYVNNLQFVLRDSLGSPVAVRLQKVLITPVKVKKVKTKHKAGYDSVEEISSDMICLLGLDVVKSIGGKLILDPSNETGEIKF